MRWPNFLATLAVVTALTAAGTLARQDRATAAAPPPSMPAPEVGIVTLKAQALEVTEDLPGRTSPYQVAEIRPQVSGIILKRFFTEGSNVKEGDQLYQIDPATYEAALSTANAVLHKAQAVQVSAKNLAGRYKQLVAVNAISKQSYDDAVAAMKSAEADVASAQAAVLTAQINLGYTKVMAPISGHIGKSSVTPGALVTANQATALATITQLDPIYVDVTQSSAQLMKMRQKVASGIVKQDAESTAVDLYLDDINQRYAHQGTLKFSDVTVDPATGSVEVRAEFPNPEGTLLPGLFVRAIIHEGQHNAALAIPQQAVTRDPSGGASVWVVGADNKVQKANVTTGDAVGDKWIALDGVKEGDRLVVQGTQKVQPGMAVRTVAVDQPAAPAAAPETTPAATEPAASSEDKSEDKGEDMGDNKVDVKADEKTEDQTGEKPDETSRQ